MKRAAVTLSIFLGILLGTAPLYHVGADTEIFLYDGGSTTPFTSNTLDDINPEISDNGVFLFWERIVPSDPLHSVVEVLVCDGVDTTKIFETDGKTFYLSTKRINNDGQAAMASSSITGFSSTVHLYDGTQNINLGGGWEPRINNGGQVAWYDRAFAKKDLYVYSVYLYDGTNTIPLAEDWDIASSPEINDSGSVVWFGRLDAGGSTEIFLYHGTGTTQITDNLIADDSPDLNEGGSIVWQGAAGPGDTYEIFLYAGTDITQLTTNDYTDANPLISDNGKVVWRGRSGPEDTWELFLYDGSDIIQLTDNSYDEGAYRIGADGSVVWQGLATAGGAWEIFLYDGTNTKRLTWNGQDDTGPRISADGSIVVWEGEQPDAWSVSGSVVPEHDRPASDVFNHLCLLLLPVAIVVLWKRRDRAN